MSVKASDACKNARRMIKDGYVYVYGYKGTKVTKAGVSNLARMYPSVFTSSIKSMAMNKVGKIGIETTFTHTCESCQRDYKITLPITGEFFGPSED